jgi:hypothetical protein
MIQNGGGGRGGFRSGPAPMAYRRSACLTTKVGVLYICFLGVMAWLRQRGRVGRKGVLTG